MGNTSGAGASPAVVRTTRSPAASTAAPPPRGRFVSARDADRRRSRTTQNPRDPHMRFRAGLGCAVAVAGRPVPGGEEGGGGVPAAPGSAPGAPLQGRPRHAIRPVRDGTGEGVPPCLRRGLGRRAPARTARGRRRRACRLRRECGRTSSFRTPGRLVARTGHRTDRDDPSGTPVRPLRSMDSIASPD